MASKGLWGEFFKSLKNNDWPGAIKNLDKIIKVEPENPNHYLKRGDIYRRLEDKGEAVDSYINAAWYFNRDGFLKKALAVYKMVLRIDRDNRDAIYESNRIMMEIAGSQSEAAEESAAVYAETEDATDTPERERETETAERIPFDEAAEETSPEEGPFTKETGPSGRETEKAAQTGFLSPFANGEIEEILKRSEVKLFSDGDIIVREGDTGDSVYIIKRGNASVVTHILGKEMTLATLSSGDLFGEVAFLTGRPRTANVVAIGEIETYVLDRLLLNEIIGRRPEIMSQINEIYMTRVKDTIRKAKEK